MNGLNILGIITKDRAVFELLRGSIFFPGIQTLGIFVPKSNHGYKCAILVSVFKTEKKFFANK